MHFSTVATILAAAGSALAGPAPKRPQTEFKVSIDDASCGLDSCIDVVEAAGCIAMGISGGDLTAVVGCLDGGQEKLCGCAGCIDALGDFLEEHDVC